MQSVRCAAGGALQGATYRAGPLALPSDGAGALACMGKHNIVMFTGELCSWPRFSLVEILVLATATGAGRMVPPVSTRISARLKRVQEHSSLVNVVSHTGLFRISLENMVRMQLQPVFHCSSLTALDPGSGR